MHRYFLILIFLSISQNAFASAWLQPQGVTEIHFEHTKSEANAELDGISIPYQRDSKQLYGEYGFNDELTLVGKYYQVTTGEGLARERSSSDGLEIAMRQKLNWKSGSFVPIGSSKLLRNLSPDGKITRTKKSSFDIGLGQYTYNSDTTHSFNFQITRADKIETHHKNPISVQTEFLNIISIFDNNTQGTKLISRLQLGYRNWHIGYERLDGKIWSQNSYYESLWLWEVGIPVKHHLLRVKWGHDRTRQNLPRENFVRISFEIRFGALAQIWRGGLK